MKLVKNHKRGCWLALQKGKLAKPRSCSPLSHPFYNSRSRKSFQHYSQACISSCPTRATGSCPVPFFLVCFHRTAEGGRQFTKCIPLVTKLWSGVRTARWRLESCAAAEQRREIPCWGAPKNPHVSSHPISQATSTCFVKRCRYSQLYCNDGSLQQNSTGS